MEGITNKIIDDYLPLVITMTINILNDVFKKSECNLDLKKIINEEIEKSFSSTLKFTMSFAKSAKDNLIG